MFGGFLTAQSMAGGTGSGLGMCSQFLHYSWDVRNVEFNHF